MRRWPGSVQTLEHLATSCFKGSVGPWSHAVLAKGEQKAVERGQVEKL